MKNGMCSMRALDASARRSQLSACFIPRGERHGSGQLARRETKDCINRFSRFILKMANISITRRV